MDSKTRRVKFPAHGPREAVVGHLAGDPLAECQLLTNRQSNLLQALQLQFGLPQAGNFEGLNH